MKPPILRVKKGATIYDDDAPSHIRPEVRDAWRRRLVAEEEHAQRRGPGGRRVMLAALIAIAGLFLLWSLVPRSFPDRSTVAGWQAILRATHSADTLIVGVTFIATPQGRINATATIDFTVAGTQARESVSATLEKSPMTIRRDIPFVTGMKEVRAQVSIDGKTITIRANLPGE